MQVVNWVSGVKGSMDAWWNPQKYALKKEYLGVRSRVVASIRHYFAAAGFNEVETPILQVSPGLEPHLHAFATALIRPDFLPGKEPGLARYLHTSPEFTMKKLLVAGEERIYQLARCFRNRERSATHHPEFTMLEWYRTGVDYTVLMQDCESLLLAAAAAGSQGGLFTWQGMKSDPRLGLEKISVADAFDKFTGIDLLNTAPDPLHPDPGKLRLAAEAIGIRCRDDDSWEDIFFRVFLDRIEPKLGCGRPTILYDYPVSMAALSRPKASDTRLAERFEIYVCGLELANAFSELRDASVQRARFRADMEKKKQLYGETYPIDEDFLAALAHGYPESAGIALGIDRLVMLASGADHIEKVLWAPADDWSDTNRA